MAKKNKAVENYEDIFKDLQASQKEVEELVKKASEEVIEVEASKETLKVEDYKPTYAYGIHKNKETNKWEVTEIIYNTATLECRINDTMFTSTSRAVAQVKAEEFIARRSNNLSIPEKQKRG